jgi:hypothetical protein
MAQLASLPILSVQIAFNPTNLQTLTQTWTEVTPYVQDFTTSSGRQHFLDRIEASTVRMTLDNRSGYFLNQPTSTAGSIIRPRLPIRIFAGTPQINVTAISGSGTVVTYTAANTYTTGQQVVVQGATIAGYNGVFTVASASSTQFTVASSVTGATSTANAAIAYPIFWGLTEAIEERTPDQLNQEIILSATDNLKFLSLLYMNRQNFWPSYANTASTISWFKCDNNLSLADSLGATTGQIIYNNTALTDGPRLYDTAQAIDLTNGDTTTVNGAVLYFQLPSSSVYGIDFWIIGNQLANGQICTFGNLYVNADGKLQATTSATYTSPIRINDGLWHHVAFYATTITAGNAAYYLSVDGVLTSLGTNTASGPGEVYFGLGGANGTSQAYVSDIIFTSATSTVAAEVANRASAGHLLDHRITSGDRIAEILVLAGYGTLTSGALVPSNYTVNDVTWSANAGAFFVQSIQSSTRNSTALDLIQQVTDTDIGVFFQTPSGVFEFDSQAYLYSASNNVAPSGAYVWADSDGSNVTFYEAASLSILRDDADVWTTVKITAQNGTEQVYENTANEPLYGYSTLTKSSIAATNEQAMQSAIYLSNLYQSPLPRVQNVELNSKTNNGFNLAQMLSHYINDGVQFVRNQNGSSDSGKINSTMVTEGIRHDFKADPGDWASSFTFDPYPKRGLNSSPKTFFMLFDDSTFGKFDSNNDYL